MRERRGGNLGAWLRNLRHVLTFGLITLCCFAIAFYLLWGVDVRHMDYIAGVQTAEIALAFVALGSTFNIAVLATAPSRSRGLATPHRRWRDRPLPRLVALGMLVPITAECGMVWFALHLDFGALQTCTTIAFVLNPIGMVGIGMLRTLATGPFQATPSRSDPSTAPFDPVVGS